MDPARLAFVIVLAGAPLGGGIAAGEEEAGPSIDEMFSALEEERSAPATTETRGASPEKEARAPKPLSTDVAAEVRKIEARASERLAFFRKDGRTWQAAMLYIRLEKFNEAARLVGPMLRSRNAGRTGDREDRTRIDKLGEIELVYACIMTYLGRDEIAASMLAAYRKKFKANYHELAEAEIVGRSWVRNWHEPRVAFVKSYAKHKREVDRLEAAIAEKADPKTQWALVKLCDPENGRASLALKYFTTLVDAISRFPDHSYVRSGAVMWELEEAYRIHELYEEAIRLIESMPERFPREERVRDGSWLYFLGKRYCNLGSMREEVRDRRGAVEAYRKSLESFRRMRKEHPKHRYCREQEDGDPAVLDEWIEDVTRNLRRVGGR
ncbi:MAG: tetratricopeptide repeat protein [Planctomycetota bacterium]|jgi:tetratricopeptide (TPR) repeat protein